MRSDSRSIRDRSRHGAAGLPRGPGASRAADSPRAIAARVAPQVRPSILAFFDERRRDLPWRRTSDPYRVWVSEVMLQQTRVEAVVPYYERWVRRFPTLVALAEAEQGDVLRSWEGLGYYARARNLHRAAQLVRERHAGRVPADLDALRALPGVGDYTAGAVASIAYGVPAPAVDGNVRRVLCRLFDLEAPRASALRATAAELVPADRPGDFNQGLMELGSVVCTPRSPRCESCPLARLCLARSRGTQALRPARDAKRPVPFELVGTALVRDGDGRVLLRRRPENGLLGGMWELPGRVPRAGETTADAARRAACASYGTGLPPGRALSTVSHVFSHRRVEYHAFLFETAAIEPLAAEAETAWAGPAELAGLAIPVAQRRILALDEPHDGLAEPASRQAQT